MDIRMMTTQHQRPIMMSTNLATSIHHTLLLTTLLAITTNFLCSLTRGLDRGTKIIKPLPVMMMVLFSSFNRNFDTARKLILAG
jgi:hypothetical protein